jgi:hypothetical protein
VKTVTIQCKRLVEIKAMYAENAKREIEEQMVRWGVSSREDGGPATDHCHDQGHGQG